MNRRSDILTGGFVLRLMMKNMFYNIFSEVYLGGKCKKR